MVYSIKIIPQVDQGQLGTQLSIDKVRNHINAHISESDTRIEEILKQACSDAEDKTQTSVLPKIIELTHARPDILLPKPPVQSIMSIHLRDGRKWKKLFESSESQLIDESVFTEYFLNNGARLIRLNDWKEGQRVKIIYKAGYWNGESPHKIPYAIHEYILSRCYQIYSGTKGTREFQIMQKDIISPYMGMRGVVFG